MPGHPDGADATGPHGRWTGATARVLPLLDGTRTAAEVAAAAGCQPELVYKVAKAHGGRFRRLPPGFPAVRTGDSTAHLRVRALLDGTRTIAEIAALAGCTVGHAYNVAYMTGLPFAPAKPGRKPRVGVTSAPAPHVAGGAG